MNATVFYGFTMLAKNISYDGSQEYACLLLTLQNAKLENMD